MSLSLWHPPVALAPAEQVVYTRIKYAKLFRFLRDHRLTLFSDEFQAEFAVLYTDSHRGQPPVPPAQLALALILQSYTGYSDDAVIEALLMDRRWQLTLDCLNCDTPPFSKGTFVAFRNSLLPHHLDRRLLERTLEIAASTGGFNPRALRAALDSSALAGAGRVEDTYNLLGHAMHKAIAALATLQGRALAEVVAAAGASLIAGSSLKATLDCNWDDPVQREAALRQILQMVEQTGAYLDTQAPTAADPTIQAARAAAAQVQAQDVVPGPTGEPVLRQGVAPDRRISMEDAAMRHGRKSRSVRIDGYKRHIACDLDTDLVVAVGLTPANVPEAQVGASILADLARLRARVVAWYMDRAYLSSVIVAQRAAETVIHCKSWEVHNGAYFAKTAFYLDWERRILRCPNNQEMPFTLGGRVQFPAAVCAACPLQDACTESPRGRSVAIHPEEQLLGELRERQARAAGRADLRQRVGVEHSLAHAGQWQGDRARYWGVRKNLADGRRVAVVNNLHVLARHPEWLPAAA
ncbi:MAG: IS1182 family transposase [Candidatus Nephthysia bennettiae]|nr:MAG: IS1182 family transposase [Candidatus Dormibacteraeota bacterium]